MWIFGAFSPDLRDALELADRGARQQRRDGFVALLDQRRDPPLAVAGEVDVGRVDDRRRVGIAGRRLGAEGGLGREAFDRGWDTAPPPAVRGLRCGREPRAPFSLPLPVFVAARSDVRHLGHVEGDLGVGRPGCDRCGRRRTDSGSRLCRRRGRPERRPVRQGVRRLLDDFAQGPALRRFGNSLLRRRGAALGGRPPRSKSRSRSRHRSRPTRSAAASRQRKALVARRRGMRIGHVIRRRAASAI